ncbi:glycosyl transferase family 2 [Paludibacter propionicigenes WB4]|uniref:Glycosyl transferase family 2 n=1 Tax=Paludibacter propionicigenes (strain DSM 17365 / JCM 13257 / WB4) TaxID=694427 RepID=E4T1H6_PALPW|nr:glycosyltransferase family 2 protein [Paludibacter propionicigenes]ADQ78570.1 glycosyl transferase family 2 [Paludibacter propionicigenes WB4]
MNQLPQVSIITVGMNHLDYIVKLYQSLFRDNKPTINFEAIYVDNCSTDGSVEYITINYPSIKVIQNQQPCGFGENNNIGVFASRGKYIAIINPDIILFKGSLDKLFHYAESSNNFGIIVPKLLNSNLTFQHSVRSFINLKILFYRALSRGKDESINSIIYNYLRKDIDVSQCQFVDWALGAALFLSREHFARLKGFDLDYFLYMEDEDLCLRSWKLGKPVIYYPESTMIHNHQRASSKFGKKTLLHVKSMLMYFKKHGLSSQNFRLYTEQSENGIFEN